MRRPVVINLYGGPGCGKSTTAYKLAGQMKEMGYMAELVTEFAKDLTWQKSFDVLRNQIYIFANQQHRMWRVKDEVDYIITDSPLLISMLYNSSSEALNPLIIEEHNKYVNLDIFLERNPDQYQKYGRTQSLEESMELDRKMRNILALHTPHFFTYPGKSDQTVGEIIADAVSLKNKITK